MTTRDRRWRRGVAGAVISLALAGSLPTAHATPGDLVTTFGTSGRSSIDAGFQTEAAPLRDTAPMPDGRTVVLLERYGDDTLARTIIRLDTDGALDSAFNGGGAVSPPTLSDPRNQEPTGVEVDAQQRVLYFARTTLTRYTAAGALDTSFAGDGSLDLQSLVGSAHEIRAIQVLPDGRVELLVDYLNQFANTLATVVRVTPAGAPDPTFSGDGRLDLPTNATAANAHNGAAISRDASGNLYVLITSDAGRGVAKISSAGVLASAYGGDGDGVANPPALGLHLALDGAGRIMSFGSLGFSVFATRLTVGGLPDASWSSQDYAETTFGESISALGDVHLDGTTAFLAVECTCQPSGGAGMAAIDLTTGAPKSDFDPGDADGAGFSFVGPGESTAVAIDPGPNGTVRLGMRSTASPAIPSQVVQVTDAGALDGAYADAGRATVALRRHRVGAVTDVAIGPDGEVISVGTLDTGGTGMFVARTTQDGDPDPSFGVGGRVVVPPATAGQVVESQGVVVLPDGRIAALVTRDADPVAELRLYDTDGGLDSSFSGDGVLVVGVSTPAQRDGTAIALTTAGTGPSLALYVGGVTATVAETNVFVQRVTLAGTVDQAYGAADGTANGWAGFAFPVYQENEGGGLALAGQPDGRVMWGSPFDPPTGGPDQGFAIGRYAATGAVDSGFGIAGVRVHVVGFNQENATVFSLTRRADGGADLLGRQLTNALAIRVTGTGALDTAYAGDGVASVDLDEYPSGGTSQGERATFTYRTSGAGPTKLFRLSAAGAPDPTMGPNGLRTTAYTPRTDDFIGAPANRFVASVGAAVLVGDAVPFAGPGEALGADAELIKISTEPSAPSPPLSVHAVGGDAQAIVSWSPPASDGGATITGFTVMASPGGATCATTASGTACAVTGLTSGQPYTFTVTATNSAGTSAASAPSNSVTPAAGTGAFVPLASPKRFVDSRNPAGDTDDELEERFGSLNAGTTRAIPVAGRLGLTADVSTVVLSVVAVSPTGSGYLTVFPCGTPRPSTSSLNFTKAVNLANTVITTLGVGGANAGKVCVFTSVKTDLIIDASGSLAPSALTPLASPKRFVDSRNPTGDTDDELEERFGSLNAGTTRAIPIAGRLGFEPDTANVVLSVVAVSPTASGYLTVFPCGTPQPSTSSLNFTKAVNLANTVITSLGTGGANAGKVCVFTSVRTDLIIDASGSLSSPAFTGLDSPKRFADSRLVVGDTDDEQEERFGSLNPGTTRAIPIAGRLGFEPATRNVVLSVVAVSPTASGYLTVFPCGTPMPSTSSLNFSKSVNLANTVITTLGTGGANAGKVCVFTSVRTDLIIDASGSLT